MVFPCLFRHFVPQFNECLEIIGYIVDVIVAPQI